MAGGLARGPIEAKNDLGRGMAGGLAGGLAWGLARKPIEAENGRWKELLDK